MKKELRTRSIPPLERGDFLIGEGTFIDKEILNQIDSTSTAFVVDGPPAHLLKQIFCQVEEVYPNDAVPVAEKKEDVVVNDTVVEGILIMKYSLYQQMKEHILEKKVVVFVNIQDNRSKKRILAETKRKACVFYFFSNIYKIENISKIEKIKTGRILINKIGFGHARTANAFARKHEVVFVGAPHLKQNGFFFAVNEHVTTPCIVTGSTKESLKSAEEAINNMELLKDKHTSSSEEYVHGKKWILFLTHKELFQKVFSSDFAELHRKTASVFSYDAVDRTSILLAMHQVAKSVITLCTTVDRGKAKKISSILPHYGINMGPIVSSLKEKQAGI